MKKNYFVIFFLTSIVTVFLFFGACKHEPVAGPVLPPDECDTLNVTYTGTVYPILNQNCISCHSGASPSAGLDFTNYETIAIIAENGSLLGVIRHEQGFSPMPQNSAKLSDCDIAKFEIWIRDTTFVIPPVGIPCDPDTVYFQNTILPLLQSSCALSGCHDAASASDGVILTDYDKIMSTAGVRPFNADGSNLYEVMVEDDPDKRMPPPPRNPLTTEQTNAVYKWIMQGAKNNYCDDVECDSLNVTYSATVWPIIQNRCYGCHSGGSPSGGISLENHANLVALANSGQLMGAIRHDQGYSPMPKNGAKLSDCNISQIQKWINDGTPNN